MKSGISPALESGELLPNDGQPRELQRLGPARSRAIQLGFQALAESRLPRPFPYLISKPSHLLSLFKEVALTTDADHIRVWSYRKEKHRSNNGKDIVSEKKTPKKYGNEKAGSMRTRIMS